MYIGSTGTRGLHHLVNVFSILVPIGCCCDLYLNVISFTRFMRYQITQLMRLKLVMLQRLMLFYMRIVQLISVMDDGRGVCDMLHLLMLSVFSLEIKDQHFPLVQSMLGLLNLISNSILSDQYDIVHFGPRRLVRMDLLLVFIPKGLVLLELDISLYIRLSFV